MKAVLLKKQIDIKQNCCKQFIALKITLKQLNHKKIVQAIFRKYSSQQEVSLRFDGFEIDQDEGKEYYEGQDMEVAKQFLIENRYYIKKVYLHFYDFVDGYSIRIMRWFSKIISQFKFPQLTSHWFGLEQLTDQKLFNINYIKSEYLLFLQSVGISNLELTLDFDEDLEYLEKLGLFLCSLNQLKDLQKLKIIFQQQNHDIVQTVMEKISKAINNLKQINITKLELDFSHMNLQQVKVFKLLTTSLSELKQLEQLNLTFIDTLINSPSHIQCIKQLANKLVNIKDFKLNLAGSGIEQNSQNLKILAESIQEICKQPDLEKLDLDISGNTIGKCKKNIQYMSQIFQIVSSSDIQYFTLNLGINNLDSDEEEVKNLFQNISKLKNSKLQSLQISFCNNSLGFQPNALECLAQNLGQLQNIQDLNLNLSCNNLSYKDICIKNLSENLSKLQQLRNLDLKFQDNQIGFSGNNMQDLGNMLKNLKNNLKFLQLDLEFNNLDQNQSNNLEILGEVILELENCNFLKLNLESNNLQSLDNVKKIQKPLQKWLGQKYRNIELNLKHNQLLEVHKNILKKTLEPIQFEV